ncbi:MAG: FtsQ-type POTRA domain-containing protein [Actinomycetota bacterium]
MTTTRQRQRSRATATPIDRPVAHHRMAADRPSSRKPSGNRFEAKRQNLERQAGLRRLRIVLGLTLITSLAVGAIAFVNSTWFDVDSISVIGADRSDPDLIVEASGIELGQGLHEVDQQAAVDGIALVPWIGEATVERMWTGEIIISVIERPPSAALTAGRRFALVDEHGRQLEIVDRRPEGYLPIRGIESSGVAGEPAPTEALPVIALLGALPPDVEQQVAGITVADRHLYLDLVIGGRVDFGDGSELGAKLQAAETLLARVDLRCLDTIDVRVPTAPVVTRRGPSDAGQASGDGTTQSEAGEEPDSAPVDC